MKLLILILLLASASAFSAAGDDAANIDSLLQVLEKSRNDTGKVNLLGEIAHFFSTKDLDKAVEYAEQALFLSKELKFRRGEGKALLQIGNINNDLGKVESAMDNFDQVVIIADELKDDRLKMSAYNNMGISCFNRAEYNKALDHYLRYTRLAEDLNDIKFLSRAYNNVANVYIRLNDYNKALEYHFKGLGISEKLGDKVLIAGSYNNIGIVYKGLNQNEKAMEYYFKTLALAEELNHKLGITYALNNIGTLYTHDKKYDKALPYIMRALVIKKEIGEQKGIANTLNNAGACYLGLKRYNDALKAYLESSKITQEIGENSALMLSYEGIRNAYEALGEFEKAYKYFTLYTAVKDSIYNKEKSEQIAEMVTRFETEKKEKELKLQSIEMEKKDTLVEKQRIQRNALLAGLVLAMLLAGIILIIFRQNLNKNKILKKQNEKISRQNKVIEKAHAILENKNKDITESIMYAQRIQQAILPLNEEIENAFPESFVIYKPRDIVSGDFYWYSKVDNFYVLAVADCTGHGVPGAFMSMIGNDMLNQVVNDDSVNNPADALALMDSKISKALTKSKINTKDGIDIAIIAIHESLNFLRYSAANRPLFMIRNNEIIEYKDTNKTLGISWEGVNTFNLHTINLQKGDAVYLFTDGFADQFGGEKNKKYLTKRFKKLLLSVNTEPMHVQKDKIEKNFDEWKGRQKQVDDVCIVGIRM